VREGLLLVVWCSIGLWVGLVCASKVFTLQWVGWGLVEEIGPMDNCDCHRFVRPALGALAHPEMRRGAPCRAVSQCAHVHDGDNDESTMYCDCVQIATDASGVTRVLRARGGQMQ